MVALGALALVAVGLAALLLVDRIGGDDPLPEVAPSSTTLAPPRPLALAEVATAGGTLTLTPLGELATGPPVGLLEQSGALLLFTALDDSGEGMVVWAAPDRTGWTELGPAVPTGHRVVGVTRSGPFVLAVAEQVGGGPPVVFRSFDTSSWERIELPDHGVPEATVSEVAAVAASGDVVVVLGSSRFDIDGHARRHLPDGLTPGSASYLWRDDPFELRVMAPVGIVAAVLDAEQASVGPTELAALRRDRDGAPVTAWTSDDGGATWTARPFETADIAGAGTDPEGTLVVSGRGAGGPTIWRSTDGVGWDSSQLRREPQLLAGGNLGGALGARSDPRGPSLMSLLDGGGWAVTHLDALFAATPTLRFDAIGVGPGAVVGYAHGFVGRVGGDPPPVALLAERGDVQLLHDRWTRQLLLMRRGVELRAIDLHAAPDPGTVVDFAARTVRFDHGGVEVATFTFDELDEIASLASLGGRIDQRLVATTDGATWATADVIAQIGLTSDVELALVGDAVVLAAYDPLTGRGAAVWRARLPAR